MYVSWSRRILRYALTLLCVGLCLTTASSAWALVEGKNPQVLKTFKIFGGAEATGNTMMSASPPGNVNDQLLPQTSASISGVPFDGTLVAAYLWWTGSTDQTPDLSVNFTLPNGTRVPVTALSTECQTVPSQGGFFYCRKEITTVIQQRGGGTLNGTYTLADLRARPGNCQQNPQICQARYAAWSMVLVWESPTYNIRRDIVLYDGFLHMDEQPSGAGITSFTLQGFRVGNPAEGSFTYFGLEGDRFLGSPPEPDSNADFISFRASSATSGTRLSSATPYNPPGNIWNSTISLGVDIDSFNIGASGLNLIKPGDTTAQIVCGTGDGLVPGGNGESVFLGYILLSIDTLSPNFRNRNTNKRVDKLNASVGSTLTYTIRVTNSGSLAATNTVVQDSIPANTTYIPNSTRVDGQLQRDVNGTSPIVNGINLGSIDFRGDNDREITFQVRITSAPANRRIENFFTVKSDEVGSTKSNVVVTTLSAPQLGSFTKTVSRAGGSGPIKPGDTINYEITGTNAGSADAAGVQFIDDLPKFVKFVSVFPPAGSQNASSSTGGANGTGRIDIRNILIPAGGSTKIFFTVRIFTEAEFIAAGIAADKIHGTAISNQGEARHPLISGGLKTDDPSTPPQGDPTVVTVSNRADFNGSSKTVRDNNGGNPEPNDILTYTITLRNSGTRNTVVKIDDPLPPFLEDFKAVTTPTGATVNFSAGNPNATPPVPARITVNNITLNAGATTTFVFTVKISANVPNGTLLANVATVQDTNSTLERKLPSPTLTVVSGPILSTSTKLVRDNNGGSIAPGDTLTYTITVRNTGNRTANSITVTDPINTNLENIQPGQGGRFQNGAITWTITSLAAGASSNLTFTATIKAATPDGTLISNQARLETTALPGPVLTDDPTTPPRGDPTVVRVSARAILSSTKTVVDLNGGTAQPGDQLRYTITVRNSGTAPAQDVVVTDAVDPNLQNIQPGQGVLQSGTITWNKAGVAALASIAAGASVALTFTATIRNPFTSTNNRISNQATIDAKDAQGNALPQQKTDDPSTPTPNDPTVIAVTTQPTANITKTVVDSNGGDVVPGDTLLYTITVRGGGNASLSNVVVTDAISSDLEAVSPGQGGSFQNGTITWNATTTPALASIAPGTTVTLAFTARVKANTPNKTISNQAVVRSTGQAPQNSDDPSTPTPNDPTVVTVRSRADLSASTKTVVDTNGGQILPGDVLSYTITVRNTGNVTAQSVVVTDPVDTTNLINIQPGQGGTLQNGTITWRLPSIAAGNAVTLSFTATVKSPIANGTKISNQATLAAGNAASTRTDDPSTPTDDDPTVVEVVSGPSFADSTKEVTDLNGGKVEPSNTLRYTITVRNTGTDAARNVVVTDRIDTTKLSNVTPSQGGTFQNGSVTWNATTTPALANIPAGSSVTLTFTAVVLSNVLNGVEIANQAFITATGIAQGVPTDDPRTIAQDDPTKVNVVAGSDLSDSTKTVRDNNGGTPAPGDTLTYTITIINNGSGVAQNVVITDKIDTARLVNISPGQGGSFQNGTITWNATTTPNLANIAQGRNVVLTFTAQIAPGTLAGTQIQNQAFAKATDIQNDTPTDDPTTTALDDPTTITVGGLPTLTATKAVRDNNGGNAQPGDTLTYTIIIRNNGNRAASNVVISDPIDTNLENVTPGQGGSFQNGTITWNIPSIAAGATTSRSFTATIKQNLINGVIIPNQARVSSAEINIPVLTDDPSTPQPNDPTNVTVRSQQVLAFTKAVRDNNGGTPRPGDTLTYTLTITNRGNAPAQSIQITDPINPNLDNVTPGQGGLFQNGAITWAIPSLAAGASVTRTFTARIRANTTDGTQIPNQAQLRLGNQPTPLLSDDPSTPNPNDPTTVRVTSPGLSLMTKTVRDINGGSPEPGDQIEYTITLRNTSTSPVTNVTVTDPVDTTNLETIRPGQGGAFQSNTITWNANSTPALARIAQNQTVTLTFTATIKANVQDGVTVSNQATARSADLLAPKVSDDPATPQPNDATQFTVLRAPNISQNVTKEVRDVNGNIARTVRPGTSLRYTITIRNTGSRAATNVEVADPIDSNLTNVQPGQGGTFQNGTITWRLPTLAPNQTITLTFSATIDAQTPDNTSIENQALVRAQNIATPVRSDDPNQPGNEDKTTVLVRSNADLATSTKSVTDVNGGTPQPGDLLEYTITVINSGAASAFQVRLTDSTPANTEFVTGTLRLNGRVIPDGGTNPLQNGIFVNSARPNTPSGVILANDGTPPADENAIITFRVRILPGTPTGTLISNTGFLSGRDLPPTPTTKADIIVGGGPNIADTDKQVRIAEDKQTPGVADVGDVLEYTITVRNTGQQAATQAVLRDAIPQNTQYVPGSITLDGQAQTDAAGDDKSELNNNNVVVNIGTLAPGGNAIITFRVTITGGDKISNQGVLSGSNFQQEPTDADRNDANGDQPTETPVGRRELLTATKQVSDVNGGQLLAGETLEYTITVTNSGSVALADVRVSDVMPPNTVYVNNSAQGPSAGTYTANNRTLAFAPISLNPQQSAIFLFRVTIDNSVRAGTVISNVGKVSAPKVPEFETNRVDSTIQQGGSNSKLSGIVFQDYGADDTNFDANEDERLPDFKISLFASSDLNTPAHTATSDAQGNYNIDNIKAGQYKLRYYTDKDVQYGEFDINISGAAQTRNILIVPAGRIYDSRSGSLVNDARVFLVYDNLSNTSCTIDSNCSNDGICVKQNARDASGRCGEKVPDNLLLQNQQGQRSNRLGMYRFDAPANPQRSYRVVIQPSDPTLVFPSANPASEASVASYGSFSDNGKIVAHDKPEPTDASKAKTYYLRFNVTTAGQLIQNNHIPLEYLKNLLVLTKKASVNTATVGDIITYTLTLENRSTASINYDAQRKVGGVYFTDILPRGFRLLPLSPRLRRSDGKLVLTGAANLVRTNSAGQRSQLPAQRILKFGPFTVPAQSSLTLRYQAVVGPNLPVGNYINIAFINNEAGANLSEAAKSVVRVTYDPIFDQGTVIGKVFCDKNKNRWQDATDEGVQGVRIYLDNGHYAVTDRYGKYHIQGIDPGNHMLKVDKQTLPAGSKMIDTPEQIFYISRGLMRKINFAVRCTSVTSGVQKLLLQPKRAEEYGYKRKKVLKSVLLKGSVYGPRLSINKRPRALPVSDLALTLPQTIPNYQDNKPPDFAINKRRRIKRPIVFNVRIAAGVRPASWRVDVYQRGISQKLGNLLRVFKGVGTPPPFFKWDGRSPTGRYILKARRQYIARFTLTTLDGAISQSAYQLFGVGYTYVPPRVLLQRRFPARWMGRRGIRVRGRLRRALRRLRKKLTTLLKQPRTMLKIEVHHNDSMRRNRALFLTVRRAGSIQRFVKRMLKLSDKRLSVRGFGASRPRLPNISRRNRRMNLRIELRVLQKPTQGSRTLKPITFKARVLLGKLQLPLNKRGHFSHTLKRPFNKKVRLQIWTPQGHHLDLPVFTIDTKPGLPLKPRSQRGPQVPHDDPFAKRLYKLQRRLKGLHAYARRPTLTRRVRRRLKRQIRKLARRIRYLKRKLAQRKRRLKRKLARSKRRNRKLARHTTTIKNKRSASKPQRVYPVLHPSVTLKGSELLFKFSDTAQKISRSDHSPQPTFKLVLSAKNSQTVRRRWIAQNKRTTPKAKAAAPAKRPAPRPVAKAAKAAAKGKKKKKKTKLIPVPVSKAKNVLAARLKIKLPPQGSVIRHEKLIVSGITHPKNTLTINGQKLKLNKKGEFRGTVRLKHGQKKLQVVCQDPEGNRGLIEWPIHVNLNRLFMLALAEGTIAGKDARLEGVDSIAQATAGGVLFHGRAVFYAKGQIQGKHLLKALFKKIRFTAFMETPKRRQLQAFYQQLIDPETYYPIYGDGGKQVQDVKARGWQFNGPEGQSFNFPMYVLIEADRSRLLVGNFRTQLRGIELNRYERTFYGVDINFKKRFAKHFDTQARFFLSDGLQQQMRAHVQLRGTGGSLYYLRHRFVTEGSEQVRLSVRDKDSGIVLAQIPLKRYEDYNIQYIDGRIFFKHPVSSVVDSFIITQHNLHSTLDGNPVFVEVDYEYQAVDGTNGVTVGARVKQTLWNKIDVGFSFVREGRASGGPEAYMLWGFDLGVKLNKNTRISAEFARSSSYDTAGFLSLDGGLNYQPIQYFNRDVTNRNRIIGSGAAPIAGNAVIVRGNTELGEIFKWKNVKLHINSYFAYRERGFYSTGQALEQGSTKGGAFARMRLFKKHNIQLKYDGVRMLTYDLVADRPFEQERHIFNLQYSYFFTSNIETVIQYSHTSNFDARDGLTLHGNFITLGGNWKVNKIFHVLLRQQLAFATSSRAPLVPLDHFATTVGLNLRVFRTRTSDLRRWLNTYLTATGTLRWSLNNSASIGLKSELSPTTTAYVREEVTYAQQGTGLVNTLVIGASNKIAKNSRIYGEYQLDGSISNNNSRAVVGLQHIFPIVRGVYIGAGMERAQFLDPSTGITSRTVGRLSFQLNRWKQLRVSGRYEVRYDDGDENNRGSDRIQFVTLNSLAWQFTTDIAFLARINYATNFNDGLNQGTGGTEGELLEFSAGFAYRPVRYDWIQVLFKYTNRQETVPVGLADGVAERKSTEVISLVPIFELPFRLQIVEQVALKYQHQEIAGMQPASSAALLWINRLNFHLLKKLDIGVEYRFLWTWQASGGESLRFSVLDHGLLLEAAYNVHRYVHLGIGYNFSTFSDNLFLDDSRNYSGFFVRVIGKF